MTKTKFVLMSFDAGTELQPHAAPGKQLYSGLTVKLSSVMKARNTAYMKVKTSSSIKTADTM